MGWLQIILLIVQSLPTIIKLVKEILEAINSRTDSRKETRALLRELHDEVVAAKASKDMSRLEKFLERLRA